MEQNDPISFLRQRFRALFIMDSFFMGTTYPVLLKKPTLSRLILDLEEDRFLHPDLFHLRPEGKSHYSRGEDRNLIGELNRTSNQEAKVAIIHEIDKDEKGFGQRFLEHWKNLHLILLILLTTRLYSILPTIRSRCMRVRITREKKIESNENWLAWTERYESWSSTMDREAVKKDRTSRFLGLWLDCTVIEMITEESTERTREVLAEQSLEMEDKEKTLEAYS